MVARLSDAQIHPSLGIMTITLVAAVAAINEWLGLIDPWILMRCIALGTRS